MYATGHCNSYITLTFTKRTQLNYPVDLRTDRSLYFHYINHKCWPWLYWPI